MSYIDRMKDELKELTEKSEALAKFIYSSGGVFDTLPKDEQVRMSQQLVLMNCYAGILTSRIEAAT